MRNFKSFLDETPRRRFRDFMVHFRLDPFEKEKFPKKVDTQM
jgi:hypothetical protein